jgi:serine/threonine protein kinase
MTSSNNFLFFQAGTAEVKLLEREVTILKMISHQYIINLLRVFETTTTMYLVQEKCDCELGTHLANQKENKLSENACQNVIRQTAEALYYLHRRGIIHRDLKCENILVVKSATNNIKDIEIRITGNS